MKLYRLLLVLALSACVAFIGGCDSGTSASDASKSGTEAKPQAAATAEAPEEEELLPLELVESGYTVVHGAFVEYGIILKNPNTSMGAEYPTIRITMRDASGGVLGTEEQTLNSVWPGGTVAWGGQASSNDQQPAQVEFEVLDPGDYWTPAAQMEPADFEPFVITGLTALESNFGTSFTGELENPNASAFDQVAISVLLRDESGKIVVGYSGFAESLAANGKIPFEVSSLGEVPAYSSLEAHAQPW